MTDSLDTLRTQIDALDAQLVELLAQRFAVTEQVGQYKKLHNLPSVDPAREALLFTKIRSLAATQHMNPDAAQAIFRCIVDETVRRHNEIKNEPTT